jgi:hypothetical protein
MFMPRFNPDDYVTVAERLTQFWAKYPTGRILTAVQEINAETGFVLIRAEVYRNDADTLPAATGHAYEMQSAGHVQAGSYVEVGETSAVGRALAMLGFEVTRGIASREEMSRGDAKAQAYAGQSGGAPTDAGSDPLARSMAFLSSLRQRERQRISRMRRQTALAHLRAGFADLGIDLDPLTDDELAAVVRQIGHAVDRIVEAKTIAVASVLDAVEASINNTR